MASNSFSPASNPSPKPARRTPAGFRLAHRWAAAQSEAAAAAPCGERRTERAIEHDRGDGAEARVGRGGLDERGGELPAARRAGGAQRLEVLVAEDAGRLDETGVDLRLGERPVRRREQRMAQMEDVVRELEVEERRLVLLELRRRRQDVVGQAGRLGHEDVDDDDDLELRHGLAHPLAVGERVRRVAGLDDQAPGSGGDDR